MARIFLVGSGPSLKETPMHLLKEEDVMVTNKFGMIDSHFGWGLKPKYYFKYDQDVVGMTYLEEIAWGLDNCEELFLWDRYKTGYAKDDPRHEAMPVGVGDIPRTTWIPKCIHSSYAWDNKVRQSYEWHLPEICMVLTSIGAMMQISVNLGYDEIYLVGCDLGYTKNHRTNHAIPDYTVLYGEPELQNGIMGKMHEVAKKCCPIPIYNATVGGYLEIYPRVSLEEVCLTKL